MTSLNIEIDQIVYNDGNMIFDQSCIKCGQKPKRYYKFYGRIDSTRIKFLFCKYCVPGKFESIQEGDSYCEELDKIWEE